MTAVALRDAFSQQSGIRGSLLFRLFLVAACILISTAPIYWLPGLSLAAMTTIKNAAFFGAVGLAFMVAGPRNVDLRVALPFVVAATMNFLAFQINGSTEYAVYQVLTFLAPMAWVLAIRSLSREKAAVLLRYTVLPLGLIAVAVAYALLAKFGVVPDFRVPVVGLQLLEHQLISFQRMTVSTAGFNHGSTGWGVGSSMALVLLGSILIGRDRQRLGFAILALAVLAPAAMGGRGAALGAMAAFIVAVLMIRQLGNMRLVLVFAMALVLFVASDYLVSVGILSERFFSIRSNADWFFTVDQMTTGRLTTWINALENFAKSPLVGVGVKESLSVRHTGELLAVHNVWLGFLSEGGLMAFLPAIALFGWCAQHVWRISEFRPLLVFVGIASMLEPSVIFGSFGNQVAFWTAFGFSIRALRRREPGYLRRELVRQTDAPSVKGSIPASSNIQR